MEQPTNLEDANAPVGSFHGPDPQPNVNPLSLSEVPEETQIELFKHPIDSYDKHAMGFTTLPEASLIPDFDQLFQQLKIKLASVDLLEAVPANLLILTELQELMLKLSQSKTLSLISTVVLDLEILLNQAILTIAFKRDSSRCVK